MINSHSHNSPATQTSPRPLQMAFQKSKNIFLQDLKKMVARKGFIDKENSVSYQLVHRSQKDPLQADEHASKWVLKAMMPSSNLLKVGSL